MPAAVINDQNPNAHRTIIAIVFPAILANSSAPLVGLVDTWAIGHLPDPTYLAAIGLGSVIFNFILWAFGFLRMGTTGIIAQAKGQHDGLPLQSESRFWCKLLVCVPCMKGSKTRRHGCCPVSKGSSPSTFLFSSARYS